jgi:hypothetical protein
VLKVYNGATWSSIGSSGSSLAGVTALGYTGLANGATLTSDNYLQMAYAIGGNTSTTYPGLMPGSYSDIFSTQTIDLANFGQNWVQNTSAGNLGWKSIAVSASGKYQTTCENFGSIYISSDYGSTWNSVSGTSGKFWTSVSVSASGQYQTAVSSSDSDAIYISTDYGSDSSWYAISGTSGNWISVSVSASGQYQTAVIFFGSIWISSKYGSDWNQVIGTGSYSWRSVSISASGQYQTACGYNFNIYVSSNYGSTWSTVNDTPSQYWTSVSVSASGQYQTACAGDSGLIYISSDYGSTWNGVGTNVTWISVAISSSGQYQTACATGSIYISSNYGSDWNEVTGTGPYDWRSVSISASGQYITACYYINNYGYGPDGGYIYTCQNSISNGVVSVGNYSTTPAGTTGSIYYDTSSAALKVYNGSTWSSIGSGGSSLAGVTALGNTALANGATLTSDSYLQMAYAVAGGTSTTYPGLFPASTLNLFSVQNIQFDPNTFGKNIVQNTNLTLPTNYNLKAVSISGSGKYQTAITQYNNDVPSRIYYSINYGTTWNLSSTDTSNIRFIYCANTTSGVFQVAVTAYKSASYQAAVYISRDYGSSWTKTVDFGTSSIYLSVNGISFNGQYQIITNTDTNGYIYVSSDYGTNFTPVLSAGSSADWVYGLVSGSGQYMYVNDSNGNLYISTNFGKSFSSNYTFGAYSRINSVSQSGQYIVGGYNPFATGGGFMVSSDYGNTWTINTTFIPISTVSSYSGQYVISVNPAFTSVYISSDYGNTFTSYSSSSGYQPFVISGSGQYILTFTSGNVYTCQNSISAGVVSVGNYSTTPSGSTGSIYYDTSSSALKVYNGTSWSSIGSSGSSLAGVTALGNTGLANGATLTSDNYLQLGAATISYPGIVTTSGQTFAGSKTFSSDIKVNSLTVGQGGVDGANCTAFGYNSLLLNNTGESNVAFGYNSLSGNTGGRDNTAVGSSSLETNTNGNNNVAVGSGSLQLNTIGGSNIAVGYSSLQENINGNYNVAIGSGSLISNTTGVENVAIGNNADVGPSSLTNAIVIGSGAVVYTSNTIQMGNSNIRQMNTSGTIGVGTYSDDSGASGIVGSIYYNTSDSVLKVYNGDTWSSIGSSGSSLAGVTTLGTTALYGATVTSNNYLQLAPATETYPGIVTTSGQTFTGEKTFVNKVIMVSNLSVNGGATFGATANFNSYLIGTTGTFTDSVTIGNTSTDVLTVNAKSVFGATANFNSYLIGTTGTFTNSVTLGNTSTNTLTVNATSTFNSNITLGDASTDILTVNGTSTFNNNVTLGSDATDTLTVNATSTFGATANFNSYLIGTTGTFTNSVTIGDVSTDVLTVTANSIFGSTAKFNAYTYFGSTAYFNNYANFNSYLTGTTGTFTSSVTIGDASTDTLTVTANSTFGSTAKFNAYTYFGSTANFNSHLIGTTGTFSNTVTAAAFNSTSDYRIKKDIQDLNLNIYNVNPLRPVNYYNNKLNKLDIGFIAHEVQEYYPFLVNGIKDGEETQSLNYNGLIGILVKEIQELKQRVKQLEDDLKAK